MDGKQYVAFMGCMGRPAPVVGATDAKVDGAPMLFVFEVGGTAKLPDPPPPQQFGPPRGAPAPPRSPAPEAPHN
jgi:hypothetical protein